MTARRLIAIVPVAVAFMSAGPAWADHRNTNTWECFPFNGSAVSDLVCAHEESSGAGAATTPPAKPAKRCAARRSKANASKAKRTKRTCGRKSRRR